jgi:hypothetical protein
VGTECVPGWEKRNEYGILLGNPEGKRPLGRPCRRCADNIKMGIKETGWSGVDWIDLAQDRDHWRAVKTVMKLLVPQNVRKFLISFTTGSFLRRAHVHRVG